MLDAALFIYLRTHIIEYVRMKSVHQIYILWKFHNQTGSALEHVQHQILSSIKVSA